MEGTLWTHMKDVQEQAQRRLDTMIPRMAEQQGVTEDLKRRDQMKWVGMMNNIRACVEEIIYNGCDHAIKYHRPLTGLAPEAAAALKDCRWSGNIRELQNCIEKAVILSEGNDLTEKDMQLEHASRPSGTTVKAINEADEERMVRDAMERASGNISSAAKMLGVSRPTLYAKLKKYGL